VATNTDKSRNPTGLAAGLPVVRASRNATRIVLGLAVIAAGILFTLDNLHVADAEQFLDYWPILLVLLGVVHMMQNQTTGGFIWSLVLVFAGAWMLAENLGYVSISVWKLSPLLLVALGLSIIWRSWYSPAVLPRGAGGASTTAEARTVSVVGGPLGAGDDYIKGTAIMGAFERASASADFRGGDLVAIMAGCKLDLRHAAIAGPEAVIDVLVIMGGIELRIPENWTVHVAVTPLMGGVSDQTRPVRGEATQRLVLRGTVFMGGVEIKD
jgi:hypothetical protein